MKIKHKLSSSVLIIIVGFLISTAVLQLLQVQIDRVYSLRNLSTKTLSEWNQLNSVAKGFLISQKQVDTLHAEYETAFRNFNASINSLKEFTNSDRIDPKTVKKISALIDLWDMYEVNFQIIFDSTKSIAQSHLNNEIGIQGVLSFFIRSIHANTLTQDEYQLLQTIDSNISSIEAATDSFQKAIYDLNSQLDQQAHTILKRSRFYSIGISLVIILFALIFSVSVSWRISRRVEKVEKTMGEVARRNLTVRYAGRARDEIGSLGRNLNTVLDTMHEFFTTSNSVGQGLNSLRERLSQRSSESVSEIKSITTHLSTITDDFHHLDGTVNTAKNRTQEITEVVNTAHASIEDHGNPLNRISSAIENMNNAVQEVTELTEHFGISSRKLLEKTGTGSGNVSQTQHLISDVTREINNLVHINEVIENITEQTHLLSINASIESANAGEAGKSFGVVAQEIKKLAETTADHSHKIEDTLFHITELIKSADEQSNRSAESFDAIQSQVNANVDLFQDLEGKTVELKQSGIDIVNSNKEVENLTIKLKKEYKMIQNLSAQIQTAMNTASTASGEGVRQISSIKLSVEQIEAALDRMAEAIELSHEKTAQLTHLLSSFRI